MRVAKVLRAVLTPEQYKKYEELQRQRPTGPRSATLWTYEGGGLVSHRFGSASPTPNMTEVADGLKEGALVVLRARETAP